MRVMDHNDNAIRSFKAFKHYNNVMTDIVSETSVWRKPIGFDDKIFCGTFIAKVYVGNEKIGTYKFDCTDFNAKCVPDDARVKVSRVG